MGVAELSDPMLANLYVVSQATPIPMRWVWLARLANMADRKREAATD